MMMSRAIMTTKMKLESVSKPSQWASVLMGSGKMAMMAKAKGRRSQASEIRIDIEFLRRLRMMKTSSINAAIDTSIWMLVMMITSYT